MRLFFLLSFFTLAITANAQLFNGTYYVAAKTGLSMREKPEAGSKVLDKIPYGTKVTTINEDSAWKEIITENMTGYWKKVKFNNKTGYIIDSYLFPWPPPKLATVKDMKQYLVQNGAIAGPKVVTRSGNASEMTEGGWELTKQLYKNGGEYHEFFGYEYNSNTYFLPGFSIQQGFLLCRLIAEFKQVFGEKEEFPLVSKTYKKDDHEYDVKVIRTSNDPDDTSPFTIEKIKIGFEDGAYYEFELFMLENQLVIFFSGGV
ncbi:MAG: SH3 domain-containing protein [Bacteroidetes bacterium]|nr:SH3 domain-containing protein [Bacteroidota bacterium]